MRTGHHADLGPVNRLFQRQTDALLGHAPSAARRGLVRAPVDARITLVDLSVQVRSS